MVFSQPMVSEHSGSQVAGYVLDMLAAGLACKLSSLFEQYSY